MNRKKLEGKKGLSEKEDKWNNPSRHASPSGRVILPFFGKNTPTGQE